MIRILSVDNMRESDAATIAGGTSGRELMWRAGKAIFETVEKEQGWKGRTGIICGSGNNAGDGYVLALLLKEAGYDCALCLTGERFSEDGRYYYEKCLEENINVVDIISCDRNGGDCDSVVDIKQLKSFNVIVDCLYGTGFHGEIGQPIANLVDTINMISDDTGSNETVDIKTNDGVYIISIDINSGLNGNNGLATKCVQSDLTVSVGDYQPGHFLNMAKDVMRKHVNCPIGIEPVKEPFYLLEEADVRNMFPKRQNLSNKGTYGYIALVGGSLKYGGAIRLANMAATAMRCGAGVVTVAAPVGLHNAIAAHMLESTFYPLNDENGELIYNEKQIEELINHKKAIAFGMGIGRNTQTAAALKKILECYEGTLVIDADGISDLADMGPDILMQTRAKVILTPHLGEMSRLTGNTISDIQEAPIDVAKNFAGKYGVTVLLKGPASVITDGEKVYITNKGCPGMATAGSGDVLSGIIAAICGAHPDEPLLSAACGAWINGAAGELAMDKYGDVSMIASDTANFIPEILKKL